MMHRAYGRMVFAALALAAVLAFVAPGLPRAAAQGSDICLPEATITSLRECVRHTAEMGFIDNAGVTVSLLSKLDAAASAADRGQPLVAVQAIQAFEKEVSAQAGTHIDAEHAAHMLFHAQ
ncbi:MAG TPA: hypothetical protein VGR57_02595, partial [Ktedonobacterales bacterium]|nr:hypothetical protein [Ktedonobacterales bacterium]